VATCSCRTVDRLTGNAANDYIRNHLRKRAAGGRRLAAPLRVPDDGEALQEALPHGDEQGGGSPEPVEISPADAQREFGI
jgi:hypothetical protein